MLRLTMSKSAFAASVNSTIARLTRPRSATLGRRDAPNKSEPKRPEHKSDGDKYHRPTQPRPFDATGNCPVNQQKSGKDRGILVHQARPDRFLQPQRVGDLTIA